MLVELLLIESSALVSRFDADSPSFGLAGQHENELNKLVYLNSCVFPYLEMFEAVVSHGGNSDEKCLQI